jgi:hypothetical protein
VFGRADEEEFISLDLTQSIGRSIRNAPEETPKR